MIIQTLPPDCRCQPYGTRGAKMCSPHPCVLKRINNLGAIRRTRVRRVTMGAYVVRRRVRLGVTDNTVQTTNSDTSIQYLPDIPYIQSPYANYPYYPGAPGGQVVWVAPELRAVASAQQQQQPPSPVLANLSSWFAGSSVAGVPNSILAGGFALIVGASLLKSKGRAR